MSIVAPSFEDQVGEPVAERTRARERDAAGDAVAGRIRSDEQLDGLGDEVVEELEGLAVLDLVPVGGDHVEHAAVRLSDATAQWLVDFATDADRVAGSRAKKSSAPPSRQPSTAACTMPASRRW